MYLLQQKFQIKVSQSN